MTTDQLPKVSLGEIANAAGVSRATACLVLRNGPGPSQQTRKRVLEIAAQRGYVPDNHLSARMSRVSQAKVKKLMPIAWLNTHPRNQASEIRKFDLPYFEGARAQALRHGYLLEEIWLHELGQTMRGVSEYIHQRGIEALIVTQFAKHLRFNWNHLASVSIEETLLAPRLHRVMTDIFFNCQLAMKTVMKLGYRRIGVCLDETNVRTCFLAWCDVANRSAMIVPKTGHGERLFYTWNAGSQTEETRKKLVAWIRNHHPDVILGSSSWLVQCVEEAGFRVPEEIGVVHLATSDEVSDWAGVSSTRNQIGAMAVERVISLLKNRQFGIPETPVTMSIRGTWHNGRTLLVPKPKEATQPERRSLPVNLSTYSGSSETVFNHLGVVPTAGASLNSECSSHQLS